MPTRQRVAYWASRKAEVSLGTSCQRGAAALLDVVAAGTADVEVEAPVGVVVVDVADAAVLHGGEAEARLDGAVGVQGPLAGVAVPARLQLGHQGDLLAVDPDGGAQEIAGVAAALDDRARLGGGEPEARRHVGAGRPQEALLVLPVAIGPAGVAVVLHVEDRDMGAVQDLAAAIDDVPQLHAAAGIAGRRRRAHGGEGPIDGRATADGDGVAARHPLAGGRLESRGRRPAHRPQSRDSDVRCARREPLGRPAGQVDTDDLVRGVMRPPAAAAGLP